MGALVRNIRSAISSKCSYWFEARNLPILILILATISAACYIAYSAAFSDEAPGDDLHIALLADAHLIGPQYVCCTESNDVDNDSIMKTVDRFKEAQAQIEALSPPAAAVVFLGDVIHNGYASHDLDWYRRERNAYTVGSELFARFTSPVRFVWGNHDYHTVCGNVTASHNRTALSHPLFRAFLGPNALPYSALKAGRYNLIFLNGMLGPTWDPADPTCATAAASLGVEQLAWLAGQLAGGAPAFVFLHHPLPATMRNEAPATPHPDVVSLLAAHADRVMAVFSGHYHRGLDWQTAYPFPHITLPSTRYDPDNWFLLRLPREGPERSWRLLDWPKNRGGARCSEAWEYPPGGAEPRRREPQPPETGTCGRPLLGEVGRVPLPALERAEEVPGPPGSQFNPEAPCCLAYQGQFLARCVQDGPTAACCAILAAHLRPSSAAYAGSCMCWPPFWEQAVATCRAGGRNASALLAACASSLGAAAGGPAALQWPGRLGGACFEPGAAGPPPLAP